MTGILFRNPNRRVVGRVASLGVVRPERYWWVVCRSTNAAGRAELQPLISRKNARPPTFGRPSGVKSAVCNCLAHKCLLRVFYRPIRDDQLARLGIGNRFV